jgi:drug/metabolite transporter (DMT)-like permease
MVRLGGRERGIAALLTATLFWGTSIVGARLILRDISPFVFSHLGALVSAAVLLIPMAVVTPGRLRVDPRDWWRFAVLGCLGFACGNICLNVAIQRTSAATAATLQYLAPAMTLAWGWLTRTEHADRWKAIAVVLTIAGAAVATGMAMGQFVFDPLGVLAAVGSAACFAFNTVFSRDFAPRYNCAAFAGYTFLAMGLAYFAVDSTEALRFVRANPTWLWWICLYSVVLGIVPTMLYFYALRYVEATAAAIVLAFEIVVTSAVGWLWLGERLAPWQIIGGAMVVAAVVIIERRRE